MNNFFGFPKPRQAGFGSPDIPSKDIPPLDTTLEDVVLEGVIVDFGDIDSPSGILDPFATTSLSSEDMNAFLRRMLVMDSDHPNLYTRDDVSGTILVEADEDIVKVMDVPEPSAEDAESVEDMLKVMGNENEKLQSFITDAMKNMKK